MLHSELHSEVSRTLEQETTRSARSQNVVVEKVEKLTLLHRKNRDRDTPKCKSNIHTRDERSLYTMLKLAILAH